MIEVIHEHSEDQDRLYLCNKEQNGELLVNLTQSIKDATQIKNISEFLKADIITKSKKNLERMASTIPQSQGEEKIVLSEQQILLQQAISEGMGFCTIVEQIKTALNR